MKTKQVKKLLRKNYRWWVRWLGLGYWTMSMAFCSGLKKASNNIWLAGYCHVEWKYLKAWVTFYPKAMRQMTEWEIERVVIHELMHVFLNEMRETGLDHEERCATQLQKAFSWVKGAKK